MQKTNIAWTASDDGAPGYTWNPASGCQEISSGCQNCYARTLAENYRGTPAFPNGFDLTLRPHKLRDPLKLRVPARIFVNSTSDLFWEKIPDSYRDQVLDIIELTPQHTYQVLTKRPDEMLRYSRRRRLPGHFWAGVSIEANRWTSRGDILRQVQVPIRFISAEPILEQLDSLSLDGISWLIAGGESGRHLLDHDLCERRGLVRHVGTRWIPRADRLDWIRRLRDACLANGTAFFFKQFGGLTPKSGGNTLDGRQWLEFPQT
jgi:protein gp37